MIRSLINMLGEDIEVSYSQHFLNRSYERFGNEYALDMARGIFEDESVQDALLFETMDNDNISIVIDSLKTIICLVRESNNSFAVTTAIEGCNRQKRSNVIIDQKDGQWRVERKKSSL